MPQAVPQVFHAASFAFNGEFLGVGAWQVSALSPRWVHFARDVLRVGGNAFHRPLPPPFERVGLHFTSTSGSALATFSLDAIPAASSAYLRGDNSTVERQLLKMFVESVRRVEIVRKSQKTSQPFVEAFSISERPLHVVIAWGVSQDDDNNMIAELGTHFAAAALLYGGESG